MSDDEVKHCDDPSKISLEKVTKFENPEEISEYLSKKVANIVVARIFKEDYFAITYTDETTLRVENWIEMGLWLQHCHAPLGHVILQNVAIDKEAMDFFRGMDRQCFRGIIFTFNTVLFFQAVRNTWAEELFDGSDAILRPSVIQFGSVRGFDSEYYESNLLRYRSFRLAEKIVLLDGLQLDNMSYTPEVVRAHCLKISTESIIKWLCDQQDFPFHASQRVFNVQVELLKDTPVDIIEKLFETFLADKNTASYILQIHRPSKSRLDISSGWPTADVYGIGDKPGRSAKNPATGETMRVYITTQDGYVEADSAQVAVPGDNLLVERYSGNDAQSLWYQVWKNRNETSLKGKKITAVVLHD